MVIGVGWRGGQGAAQLATRMQARVHIFGSHDVDEP